MAAPHVTGVISLIHDYTDLRVTDEFEAILKNSCIDIDPEGYDIWSGWGRINADSALKLVTFPQEIFRYEYSLAQPYVHSISDPYPITCWDWPGLEQGGVYRVKKYEVRCDVVFEDDIQTHFGNTPILVEFSSGIEPSGPGDVKYFVRYFDIVPGTLDGEGATLRSYLYEVWSMDDPPVYYGFIPRQPDDVSFMYTVIGNAAPAPATGLSVAPSPDYHPYLQWDHNAEADLLGYKIYRMVHGIEEDWVLIGDVPAGTNYFEDTEYSTPHPGPYAYWKDDADYTVTACDNAGGESKMPPFVTILVVVPAYPYPTPSKFGLDENELPHDFSLSFYPNPFNVQAVIEYALPEPSFVEIEIFNLSGQRIKALRQAHSPAGYYEIIWDASNVSSGIYFCRIQAGNYSETKRMTLLK